MSRLRSSLPDVVHRELVQALFATLPPTLIMTGLFLAVGALAQVRTHDPILGILLGLGALFSALRIGVVLHGREMARHAVEREEVERIERRFAVSYVPFALILGLFSARVLMLAVPSLHTLAAVLVVGYAAGVAAGVYVRPKIAVPSIVLSVVPVIVVSALSPIDVDRLLALVLAAFSAGGIGSSMSRYRSEAAKIEQRFRLATFSRQDALTQLPNRLALIEEYELNGERGDHDHSDWLHCIDIDGFQNLNEQHGQMVGDLVLKAAASRLGSIVGERGMPARLGGDEFCVLHRQPDGVAEVDWLAQRIVKSLAEPCEIEGRTIQLSVSVGYVQALAGAAFGTLIESAETALAEVKRRGGGDAMEALAVLPDTRGLGLGPLGFVS